MRVIVAPSDVAPVEISHPVLFRSTSSQRRGGGRPRRRGGRGGQESGSGKTRRRESLTGLARAMMPVRVAENLKLRAEEQLAAAEATLGAATSAEAKDAG